MKAKKMSRILALLLTGIMAFSVAACGNKPSDSESKTSETKVSEQTKQTETTADEELEPITLTWGFRDVNAKEAGVLSEKSEIWNYIKERFGITIEMVTYDAEKYNLLVNGNDLPDIISLFQTAVPVEDIIASGQLMPLDDLLDKYGQNITNNISFAIEGINKPYDATYMLPVGVEGESNVPRATGYFGAFAGRYDVYKAIGSPEMDGIDSFLEVAKQMQDYERERTGNDDIYAFAFYLNNSLGSSIPSFALGWEYMASTCEFNLENYQVRNAFLDPDSSRWEVFEILNKAYRMGIFDPDSFTMDVTQYNEKAQAGERLFDLTWGFEVDESVAVPGYEEYARTFVLPGTGVDFIPFICSRISPYGYTSDSARAINANCKYPERVMELLNWLDSTEGARMLYSGREGISWEYVDGVPAYTAEVYEATANGTIDEYWLQNRLMGYGQNMMASGPLAIKTEDGYPADLSYSVDNMIKSTPENNKAIAADYGCEYIGQVYEKWADEGTVKTDKYSDEYRDKIAAVKAVVLSNELQEIVNNVMNYLTPNIDEIITAKSEAEFEQVKMDLIEGCKELGLDKVQAEVESQIADAYK